MKGGGGKKLSINFVHNLRCAQFFPHPSRRTPIVSLVRFRKSTESFLKFKILQLVIASYSSSFFPFPFVKCVLIYFSTCRLLLCPYPLSPISNILRRICVRVFNCTVYIFFSPFCLCFNKF